MGDSKQPSELGDLSAYERWELPAFSGGSATKGRNSFQSSASKAIKPPTASELESIRQAAYQEGLEQGKQDGYKAGVEQGIKQGTQKGREQGVQQGLAEGQQQVQQTIQTLSSMIAQLADPVAAHEQQVSQAMTNVAIAIARSVIHRELHSDSSRILQLVQSTLATLPNSIDDVALTVNPADLNLLQQAIDVAEQQVHVETDPRVHPGGLTVSTATQLIDHTVEKRFQRTVHEMFMAASQQQDSAIKSESPSTVQEQSEYEAGIMDQVESESAEQAPATNGSGESEVQTEQSSEQEELRDNLAEKGDAHADPEGEP